MPHADRMRQGWKAIKEIVDPWYHHRYVQVPLWSAVFLGRYAWRNFFPLAALAAGVVFIVWVEQTREILANLVVEPQQLVHAVATQNLQATFFVASMAVWALSMWYAMRLLSSTSFPADHPPHPAARACAHWVNEELPRFAPLAGVATVACTGAIFLAADPIGRWMPLVAAGIVPLTWAAASLGDRVLGRVVKLHERPYPVQLVPTAAVALVAAAAGGSNLPASPAWALEHWAALGLAAWTALLVWPWWRGRRAFVDYAMLGAAAVFFMVALPAAFEHRGFRIALIILALNSAGLWATSRRRELLGITEDPGTPHRTAKPIRGPFRLALPTLCAIGLTLGCLAALAVAFAKAPIPLGTWLGTLAIVFIGLALWSFFGAMWVYLPKLAGWPALGVVPILWLAFIGQAPDHSLRDASYPVAGTPRPRVDAHFAEWRGKTLPAEDRPVLFVAAAGGGLRAAFWTANALAAADDATCGEFGRHVYAYSGVSGGSLGIAAYLAQRDVWEARKAREGNPCLRGRREEMTRMLGRDFLAPMAGSMLFAEVASRFLRVRLDNERGATLARSWARAWDEEFERHGAAGAFDRPFLELFAPAREGRPGPAVYLNATGADSGRRIVAANVASVREAMPGIVDLLHERREPLKTAGLPVREAVLNSARFTYVSPAGTVYRCHGEVAGGSCPKGKERVWERLVDGGYFENSGVATLSDVMRAAGSHARGDHTFVIVIDNSSSPVLACPERAGLARSDPDADEGATTVSSFSGLTAPIEAFLRVREARARLEVQRLRAGLPCRTGRLIDWSLFGDRKTQKEAIEAQQQPALGWFLSNRSATWMLARVDDVARALPFRLAGCHPGPLSAEVRGLLGGELKREHCQ